VYRLAQFIGARRHGLLVGRVDVGEQRLGARRHGPPPEAGLGLALTDRLLARLGADGSISF